MMADTWEDLTLRCPGPFRLCLAYKWSPSLSVGSEPLRKSRRPCGLPLRGSIYGCFPILMLCRTKRQTFTEATLILHPLVFIKLWVCYSACLVCSWAAATLRKCCAFIAEPKKHGPFPSSLSASSVCVCPDPSCRSSRHAGPKLEEFSKCRAVLRSSSRCEAALSKSMELKLKFSASF